MGMQDYLEGMADSIDVVPIGAYYGKDSDVCSSQCDLCTKRFSTFLMQGKRSGAYGAYLLAIYDQEAGTGFLFGRCAEELDYLFCSPLAERRIPDCVQSGHWLL